MLNSVEGAFIPVMMTWKCASIPGMRLGNIGEF
jgi:hypothetical protein